MSMKILLGSGGVGTDEEGDVPEPDVGELL